MLHDTGKYVPKEISTSRGFLFPLPDADKWCLKRIDIEKVEVAE
jgi:hypothetical protein